MEHLDRFEVYLRLSDGDDDPHLYVIEHWFADRPEAETVAALLEEAKRDFARLYPGVEVEDFSVEVRRLRPVEVYGPRLAAEQLG